MKIHQLLSLLIIGILTMSCSSGGSDSPPTGNETQLYDVIVSMSPSEGGTISPSADSSYEEGTQVTLQANSIDSYTFSGWTGTIDTTANPVSITVDKDYNLTANFQIKSYELTVDTNGEGTVTEQIVQQKTDYEHGTIVKLNAEPAQGWEFVEWQGDITSTNNPDQITVDDSKSVTAVFEKKSFALTINTSGNGSVTKNPDQAEYEYSTVVELTANSDSGWEFKTWDGDTTSTDNPLSISIDSSITVTAVFTNPTFAGGSGTQEYPYQVSSLDQLQEVRNYSSAHFIQINDIDASATSTWNSGAGFLPIGDDVLPFTGSFNGQEYKISNLLIDRNSLRRTGLFGYAENATFEAISLVDADITGAYFTAGLVGWMREGEIMNSSVTGVIDGQWYSGGLVGRNSSNITNSHVSADVTGSKAIGGLIGQNDGNISNSSFKGSVSSNYEESGGLVALHGSGEIINSYSEGNVSSTGNMVGGLIGSNKSQVINSYSNCLVTGDISIGGLVGVNEREGDIKYSYATGDVSGNSDLGGLVGTNGAIINSSYWDIESSNRTNGVGRGSSDGTTGLNTTEMTDTSAKTNMSAFDFVNIWVTTSSYPALFWE